MDIRVANIVDVIIDVGFMLLYSILMDITVVGTSVKPLVFNRRNVIILCDAVSLLSFSSWRDFIAFNPNGVAALPSPKILAAIFDEIYPKLSWFLVYL